MLTRTFRVNVGASASSDLDILTIWDPMKELLRIEKLNKRIVVFTIDLNILMQVRK